MGYRALIVSPFRPPLGQEGFVCNREGGGPKAGAKWISAVQFGLLGTLTCSVIGSVGLLAQFLTGYSGQLCR